MLDSTIGLSLFSRIGMWTLTASWERKHIMAIPLMNATHPIEVVIEVSSAPRAKCVNRTQASWNSSSNGLLSPSGRLSGRQFKTTEWNSSAVKCFKKFARLHPFLQSGGAGSEDRGIEGFDLADADIDDPEVDDLDDVGDSDTDSASSVTAFI